LDRARLYPGVRYEESSQIIDDGRASKKRAEEWRAKREAEIIEQAIHGRGVSETFAGAVVSYLEGGGSKRFIEPILNHFGTMPLMRIDQDAIDQGARKVYPNASNATRDRQFYTPVSAVMKHAAKRGWCAPFDFERPEKPRGRVRALTVIEANRLIEWRSPSPAGDLPSLHGRSRRGSTVAGLA
jgi:hypothetical protein